MSITTMTATRQTILVTGGAGFIGSNFIHYWRAHHPEDAIINLDALTYAGHLSSLHNIEESDRYHFVHGDITNAAVVDQVMNQVDVVVHFAAESHVDRSISNPEVFLQTNVLGTFQLLRSALQHKIKRFHHISTDEVFGSLALESTERFTELTRYDPRSPYAASKASSDHLVRAFGETYGLQFSITNCSNNYGEHQLPEKLIPKAITDVLNDRPITVYGDGCNVRDWLYVQDHCQAIERCLELGESGCEYVVGGLQQDINNLQVAQLILRLMGKADSFISLVADRPGHDRRYAVDWTKIRTDLKWQPSRSLEDGLITTINWYRTNEWWWRPLLSTATVANRQHLQ